MADVDLNPLLAVNHPVDFIIAGMPGLVLAVSALPATVWCFGPDREEGFSLGAVANCADATVQPSPATLAVST